MKCGVPQVRCSDVVLNANLLTKMKAHSRAFEKAIVVLSCDRKQGSTQVLNSYFYF